RAEARDTPVKPSRPATIEIARKISAHFSIAAPRARDRVVPPEPQAEPLRSEMPSQRRAAPRSWLRIGFMRSDSKSLPIPRAPPIGAHSLRPIRLTSARPRSLIAERRPNRPLYRAAPVAIVIPLFARKFGARFSASCAGVMYGPRDARQFRGGDRGIC